MSSLEGNIQAAHDRELYGKGEPTEQDIERARAEKLAYVLGETEDAAWKFTGDNRPCTPDSLREAFANLREAGDAFSVETTDGSFSLDIIYRGRTDFSVLPGYGLS